MNEPQVWTLIGVFSAAIFAVLGLVSGLFTQVIRAEIGKVAIEVRALDKQFDGLRREVNGRIDGLNGRIDGLSVKFDSVDRDIQAIARRVFPEHE